MPWLGATGETEAEEADIAWRSALAAVGLVIFGQLAFGAIAVRHFGVTQVTFYRAGHVVLALVVLAGLALLRRRRSVGAAVAAFYVLVLPMIPLFWTLPPETRDGMPWTPFVGHKLTMVGLAVLMPGPAGWAIALLVAVAAQVLLQFYVGFGADPDVLAFAGEPWVTLIYFVIAVLLILFRAHYRNVGRRYARSRAQAEALAEIARFLLAVRDMYNTPLQTLEIDTAILERRHPESGEALKRMRRSIGELRELSRVLSRYDRVADWHPADASFDTQAAMRWLESAERAIRPDAPYSARKKT